MLLDGVGDLDSGGVLAAHSLVSSEFDLAGAHLGLDCELDVFGVGLNGQGLVQGVELLADLGELSRVDGDDGRVLSLGDGEVLLVKGDEGHGELSGAHGLVGLEAQLKMRSVIFSGKGDAVGGVGQLHHLG